MQTLLFGTNNPHKLRELREILSGHYEVKSLADLGIDMEVEETEDTLQGNAFLKVDAYAKASGLPTFADDTGLAVDVLDGRPGVYAARYAGEGCKPEDNINKLLGEMEGETERSARFITVIAYKAGSDVHYFEGKVEGNILDGPTGGGGFGYDPVFQPTGYDQSFAEMKPEEKNAISHRGRAVKAFTEFLLQQNQ